MFMTIKKKKKTKLWYALGRVCLFSSMAIKVKVKTDIFPGLGKLSFLQHLQEAVPKTMAGFYRFLLIIAAVSVSLKTKYAR